jgi:hypothetical protein
MSTLQQELDRERTNERLEALDPEAMRELFWRCCVPHMTSVTIRGRLRGVKHFQAK